MIRRPSNPIRGTGIFAGYSTYEDYLLSDTWASRRAKFAKAFPPRCFVCEAVGKDTCLHHLSYVRIGSELDSDMIWLCMPCHDQIHRESKTTLPDPGAHLRMRSKWVYSNAGRLDRSSRKSGKKRNKGKSFFPGELTQLIQRQNADMNRTKHFPLHARRP